jgi:hypothetical protein
MAKMTTTGIIGFFDILGYKSFLENNPAHAAREVVDELVGLEKSMAEEIRKAFSRAQTPAKAEEVVSLLKWLVFSDTILLYTVFEDSDSPGKRSNRWISLNFACLLLWRRMFEFGLPLRGVVHAGEFLVEGTCFAGRAIVEAYHLAQDLELSACVYSHAAFDALVHLANNPHDELLWSYIPTQLFEYQIPRRSQKSERMFASNPLTIVLQGQQQYFSGDIRQLVHEAFWKHNKDIPEPAQMKLRNTEQFLRAARFVFGRAEGSSRIKARFEKKPEK